MNPPSTHDHPSAFTDSPEDLMRKARALVAEGKISPEAALLMTDLARELGKSRASHASRLAMVQSNASEMEALRSENKLLHDGTALQTLRSENARLKGYRVLAWALAVAIAFSNLATYLATHR